MITSCKPILSYIYDGCTCPFQPLEILEQHVRPGSAPPSSKSQMTGCLFKVHRHVETMSRSIEAALEAACFNIKVCLQTVGSCTAYAKKLHKLLLELCSPLFISASGEGHEDTLLAKGHPAQTMCTEL